MSIQRTKFHIPSTRGLPRSQRLVQFAFDGGLNASMPPWQIRPNESPYCENLHLTLDGQGMQHRSILSNLPNRTAIAEPDTLSETTINAPLGAGFVNIIDSPTSVSRVLLSYDTMFEMRQSNFTWRTVPNYGTADKPSVSTDKFYDLVQITDSNLTRRLFATNNHGLPFGVFVFNSGVGRNLVPLSADSYAKYITGFNERAIYFNSMSSTSVAHPTRVHWSVKGNPTDFTSIGAGFQDLADMVGEGTGLISVRDKMILTSADEVWAARARNDAFAFDFFPLERSIGNPNPRSLVDTAAGPVWLGPNNMFYRLFNDRAVAIGEKVKRYLDENLRESALAFATYDDDRLLYRFFFSDSTGEYPTRSLDLRVDTLRRGPVPGQQDAVWTLQQYGSSTTRVRLIVGAAAFLAGGRSSSNTSLYEPYEFVSSEVLAQDENELAPQPTWTYPQVLSRNPDQFETSNQLWLDYSSFRSQSADLYVGSNNVSSLTDLSPSSSNWSQMGGTLSLGTGSQTAYLPLTQHPHRHHLIQLRAGSLTHARLYSTRLQLRQYTGRFPP